MAQYALGMQIEAVYTFDFCRRFGWLKMLAVIFAMTFMCVSWKPENCTNIWNAYSYVSRNHTP